ncbi:MAG TPA: hypothetical protein P5337_04865 [Aestuariivirga sp.]|nr:hypothetical protein [Aestuariivirga sp.]
MTGPLPRFAYAQARLAARFGGRASEADWARLAATADAGSLVDAAKRTPLGRYLAGTSADQSIHAVEKSLRDAWRSEVAEVAGWYPARFRPVFAWLSVLPLLSAMTHLLGQGAAQPWMSNEPQLAPFITETSEDMAKRLTDAGLKDLLPAVSGEPSVVSCWLRHWKSLWPASAKDRLEMETFLAGILVKRDHQDGLALVFGDLDDARNVLARVFRRHQRSIAGALAYLGLSAIDLMRLRGEIAVRKLLPATEPGRVAA